MAQVPPEFYRQSGVIAVREGDEEIQVLLITSSKGERWVIPKGVVEPGLSPAESAAKEAWEEAGPRGTLHPEPLGSCRYPNWGGWCSVEVFGMEAGREPRGALARGAPHPPLGERRGGGRNGALVFRDPPRGGAAEG